MLTLFICGERKNLNISTKCAVYSAAQLWEEEKGSNQLSYTRRANSKEIAGHAGVPEVSSLWSLSLRPS